MSRQIYAVCLKCLFFSLALLVFIGLPALGQSASSAAVNGIVQDTTDARIPNASVKLINADTGTESNSTTSKEGNFSIPSVLPGHYRLQIEREGFDTTQLTGITLNVGDNKNVIIRMKVGSPQQTVIVDASGLNINTTDASVSTIVDRNFVANMPLNGRSFQDLILLTPGVVTNNPQSSGLVGRNGEFSVNGQRTESNYYTIDGVSANIGISPGNFTSAGIGTSVAGSTALGTTQSLVSVDALEEFRVQSSTYSAEYGRNPGGQISFTTRSGTKQWHGTAFEYIRNNFFDANDWFTDYYSKPSSAERQNDFGGTLGGPINIPRRNDGKGKTFFFFSYEGLRLIQPQPASVSYAPDQALRQSAPAILQPVLNAFPIPNGPDLGNGLAEYIGAWSNPSSIDTSSIRLDHAIGDKLNLSFRFSDTPSSAATRSSSPSSSPASGTVSNLTTKTYTFGATSAFSSTLSNDFHLNYSSNGGNSANLLYPAGGSVPVDLATLSGLDESASSTYAAYFFLEFPGYIASLEQYKASGAQRQWNIIDTVSATLGRHQLKYGMDFRRLTPSITPGAPVAEFLFLSAAGVQNNSSEAIAEAEHPAKPLYRNLSAFIQDEWRIATRLNLSMGLRWDVNPAPGATDGRIPYTVEGSGPSTWTLAAAGTPLWRTTWYNFAPRLGGAYILRDKAGWETVVRAGAGIFFDTGQQLGSYGFNGPGFLAEQIYNPSPFPLTNAQLNLSVTNPPTPPYGTVDAYSQHLQLPYTWQWNGSVQQALGKSQAFTVSYVGSHGSRLLQENELDLAPLNPQFNTVLFFQNGLSSDYDALQAQFQRQLTNGLSVLGSYTWSHSIDYGSTNTALPYERGNSDFDVRNSFSSAFSYDLPNTYRDDFARALLGGWGLDDRFSVRTAFPVTLSDSSVLDPETGQFVAGELNLVEDTPLYLFGPQYPGGRRINPAAFSSPPSGEQGDAPRNFARAFGAWQTDLAVRRLFPIHEQLKLQFRAEAFNVFNHPNFGIVNSSFGNVQFGEATATLANSLGVLNPLYQQGASRSMQFALKLQF